MNRDTLGLFVKGYISTHDVFLKRINNLHSFHWKLRTVKLDCGLHLFSSLLMNTQNIYVTGVLTLLKSTHDHIGLINLFNKPSLCYGVTYPTYTLLLPFYLEHSSPQRCVQFMCLFKHCGLLERSLVWQERVHEFMRAHIRLMIGELARLQQ